MAGSALSTQMDALKDQLTSLGYSGNRGVVVSNYTFATPQGTGTSSLLAFANPQVRDISTSCIAVQEWPNGGDKRNALQKLSYVGVPVALLALPEKVEFWSVSHPDSKIISQSPFKTSPYDPEALTNYFSRSGRQLSPESLLQAKQGIRQLSLFDLDRSLEEYARNITQERLVHRFEDVYSEVSAQIGDDKAQIRALDRLTIAVLAACILQDKLIEHTELQKTEIRPLFETLQRSFPDYFSDIDDALSIVKDWSLVEDLYQGLRSGFTFRSLTIDMLAYFYENTLVKAKEKLRKELGIHYTPRYITERILKRLPVEDLRPEERTVLDGTCGSGNMLLAAYDRLSGLLPAQLSLKERHNYLRKHLWGIDKDDFACLVARLSLLLYNLPLGDSWDIKQADVLTSNPRQMFGERPRIIVGNPPFSGTPKEGKQTEKAAEVFEKYLEWLAPGGLLGIVVPVSFLHNTDSNTPLVRTGLLENCDILEVWQLPEGVFAGSTVATAIVLARKLRQTRTSSAGLATRVERVDKLDVENFEKEWQVSNSYVVNQEKWLSNPQRQMYSSRFDYIWERLEAKFPAAEPHFCIIRNGVRPGKKGNKTHFSDEKLSDEWKAVLRLNKTGKALEPFAVNWEHQVIVKGIKELRPSKYIKYPSDELERPRTPEHFTRSKKLIVSATRNATSPWRFFAAIDREKLVVTENFHYILPSGVIAIEELAAVFNSMLANAWFASRHYQRDVKQNMLKQLPIPNFTSEQSERIRDLVQSIIELKQSAAHESHSIRRSIIQLDEIIFDAYGLDDQEREHIKRWMGQFRRPGSEWEDIELFPETQSLESERKVWRYERQWRFSGEVEAVDTYENTISLSVQGQSETIEISIPDTMPGWMLRPGVAFLAAIPWQQRYETDLTKVTWLDFELLDYGYLSDDELTALLTNNERLVA